MKTTSGQINQRDNFVFWISAIVKLAIKVTEHAASLRNEKLKP